jgi:predicted RNase H-like HicB family nuclease
LGSEAEVWVATSADLPGLVTEADSIEALRAKLPGMIADLLEDAPEREPPGSIEITAYARDRYLAA